ncbi:hypothetical protein [Mesorhizobium sp. M8A.F.Ca.ET.021.01.1.1]|uniref:hypothetical protein n=1 Tax=Mesorhizobium sp. M8A.F.Ca.ET.021.01.1.1 TaxID=2496757 RepID=UPI000FCAD347|nr:hypothetical protein [Mesorhizobium sp. M8A.F.Ca.ET.021.01.1.1]RUW57119.1 hypothetical protein EOA36_00620 [Mesorhizobium sp. M8A.F.Ca.ET.021.01.1.1]
MFEVANTTGHSARRSADAIVMNLWPSRGLLIEGIEVKVSRSDWRRELGNPAKAELIAQYCDKWWIVSPDDIVHEHELPALWGHMVVNENGAIRVKKPAPKKDGVKPLDRNFAAAMLRRASDVDAATFDAAVSMRAAELEKSFEDRVRRAVDRKTMEADRALKTLARIKEAGIDVDSIWDAKELAGQIKLGQRLGRVGSTLKHQIGTLKRALDDLTTFHDELGVES